MCHMAPPVVKLEPVSGWIPGTSCKTRGHFALCFTCLARWFPDRPDDWVAGWLIRQSERAAALARPKKRAGRQLRFRIPEEMAA